MQQRQRARAHTTNVAKLRVRMARCRYCCVAGRRFTGRSSFDRSMTCPFLITMSTSLALLMSLVGSAFSSTMSASLPASIVPELVELAERARGVARRDHDRVGGADAAADEQFELAMERRPRRSDRCRRRRCPCRPRSAASCCPARPASSPSSTAAQRFSFCFADSSVFSVCRSPASSVSR